MGWFWSSQATSPSKPSSSSSSSSVLPSPPPSQQQQQQPNSNDSMSSDPEIQKFLALFQEEWKGSNPSAQQNEAPAPASRPPAAAVPQPAPRAPATASSSTSAEPKPPSSSSWLPSLFSKSQPSSSSPSSQSPSPSPNQQHAEQHQQEETPLSDLLLPTSMSCRNAFDYAWKCQSPVGQWNAVYRYGAARSCAPLWEDFWFCMRTRGYPAEARAEAVRNYYREKERQKYGPGMPSSEDVWSSRERPVEPGTAFTGSYERPEVSDVEHNLLDMERRRRIREQLGYVGDGSGGGTESSTSSSRD